MAKAKAFRNTTITQPTIVPTIEKEQTQPAPVPTVNCFILKLDPLLRHSPGFPPHTLNGLSFG